MTEETVRKTTTLPKEHVDFYDAEVKRLRSKGMKVSFADMIRKAVANDVNRLNRLKRR